MHKCFNPDCNNLTDNPKFCSRSCAATFNNKKRPKKKYYCKICNVEVPYRRVACDKHNPQMVDWSKKTILDVVYQYEHKYGASNRYTRIRDSAKRVYRNSNKPNKCARCGYDKHYHVCHIKPIHLFDPTVPVSVVNHIDNLIALCPNCHWELDNGLFAPGRI